MPPPSSSQANRQAGAQDGRRLRSDAERNRRRILAAAAEVFAEHGLAATLDDVARRAGVGIGTVYRRFPDKDSLIGQLLKERIELMVTAGTQALAAKDPWTGLVMFLEYAADSFARDLGLRQVMMFGTYGGQHPAYARSKMRPIVDELLRRSQESGQVRADLSSTDILLIGFMLGTAAEYAAAARPEIWRRYLTLMLDGLRPVRKEATPLGVPALEPDEMELTLTARARGGAGGRRASARRP